MTTSEALFVRLRHAQRSVFAPWRARFAESPHCAPVSDESCGTSALFGMGGSGGVAETETKTATPPET